MLVGSCDGHIIMWTPIDVFILNLGLRLEGLFWKVYFEGPNRVWRALKTSIMNIGCEQEVWVALCSLHELEMLKRKEHENRTLALLPSMLIWNRWFCLGQQRVPLVHDRVYNLSCGWHAMLKLSHDSCMLGVRVFVYYMFSHRNVEFWTCLDSHLPFTRGDHNPIPCPYINFVFRKN